MHQKIINTLTVIVLILFIIGWFIDRQEADTFDSKVDNFNSTVDGIVNDMYSGGK